MVNVPSSSFRALPPCPPPSLRYPRLGLSWTQSVHLHLGASSERRRATPLVSARYVLLAVRRTHATGPGLHPLSITSLPVYLWRLPRVQLVHQRVLNYFVSLLVLGYLLRFPLILIGGFILNTPPTSSLGVLLILIFFVLGVSRPAGYA